MKWVRIATIASHIFPITKTKRNKLTNERSAFYVTDREKKNRWNFSHLRILLFAIFTVKFVIFLCGGELANVNLWKHVFVHCLFLWLSFLLSFAHSFICELVGEWNTQSKWDNTREVPLFNRTWKKMLIKENLDKIDCLEHFSLALSPWPDSIIHSITSCSTVYVRIQSSIYRSHKTFKKKLFMRRWQYRNGEKKKLAQYCVEFVTARASIIQLM